MKAIDEEKEECVKAFIAGGADLNGETEVGDGVGGEGGRGGLEFILWLVYVRLMF